MNVVKKGIVREFNYFCKKMGLIFASQKTYNNFVDFNQSAFAGLNQGRKGTAAISESSNASYESLQNLLSDAKWDADKFNQRRIDILQEDSKLAMRRDGAISIDDFEKISYGQKNEYVDFQYSSTLGKSVACIKFVNLHYHDDDKDYHLTVTPYQVNKNVNLTPEILGCKTSEAFARKITKKEDVIDLLLDFMHKNNLSGIFLSEIKEILKNSKLANKEKRAILSRFKKLSPDFESKIDIAIKKIKEIHERWGVEGKLFTGDTWYSAAKIANLVESLRAFYLLRLKENRILETKKWGKISVQGLVTSAADLFTPIDETTSIFFCPVYIDGVGNVTFVALRDKKNGDRYYMTNLPNDCAIVTENYDAAATAKNDAAKLAFPQKILKTAKRHWIIEEGHKKLNFFGFQFCASSIQAIQKHVANVLFRYTFLTVLSMKQKWQAYKSKLKDAGESILNGFFKLVNFFVVEKYAESKCANFAASALI